MHPRFRHKGVNTMLRGVNFICHHEFPNPIMWTIFSNIDVEKYTWNVLMYDVLWISEGRQGCNYVEEVESSAYDNPLVLDGCDMKNVIFDEESSHPFFVSINAFPNKDDIVDITTWDDFKKSKCDVCFVYWDQWMGTIYAKDQELLKRIYESILSCNNPIKKVYYETDVNFCRGMKTM